MNLIRLSLIFGTPIWLHRFTCQKVMLVFGRRLRVIYKFFFISSFIPFDFEILFSLYILLTLSCNAVSCTTCFHFNVVILSDMNYIFRTLMILIKKKSVVKEADISFLIPSKASVHGNIKIYAPIFISCFSFSVLSLFYTNIPCIDEPNYISFFPTSIHGHIKFIFSIFPLLLPFPIRTYIHTQERISTFYPIFLPFVT